MSPEVVRRGDLRLGPLLAEGGEGRVFELQSRPGLLFKAYRKPTDAAPLEALVEWSKSIEALAPELARRVEASAAWPDAVVLGDVVLGDVVLGEAVLGEAVLGDGALGAEGGRPASAAGLLLPRAPRRFSLRHRDGSVHLATLSYLTADPGQRAAAYGLALPAPMSPERIGIVYALARLLEALQSASPAVGHGDLSTKNVLWSLERGPEVFLLDCDSAERYHPEGEVVDAGDRRRAMTPNWDDPAIPPGSNPTFASDRYSLALIFLRVAGAAHFPLQGRQRRGEPLHIDFEIPARASAARSLDAGAPIWDLCERGLAVSEPTMRPPASAWAAALEQILDDLGAMTTVRAVWAAQGGGSPGPTPPVPSAGAERRLRQVTVRPVTAAPRSKQWLRRPPPAATPTPAGSGPAPAAPNPLRPGGYGRPTIAQAIASSAIAPVPVVAPARAGLRSAVRAWLAMHRRMLRTLGRGGLAVGLVRVAGCAFVDALLLIVSVFIVAMLVSPFLRI